ASTASNAPVPTSPFVASTSNPPTRDPRAPDAHGDEPCGRRPRRAHPLGGSRLLAHLAARRTPLDAPSRHGGREPLRLALRRVGTRSPEPRAADRSAHDSGW